MLVGLISAVPNSGLSRIVASSSSKMKHLVAAAPDQAYTVSEAIYWYKSEFYLKTTFCTRMAVFPETIRTPLINIDNSYVVYAFGMDRCVCVCVCVCA